MVYGATASATQGWRRARRLSPMIMDILASKYTEEMGVSVRGGPPISVACATARDTGSLFIISSSSAGTT